MTKEETVDCGFRDDDGNPCYYKEHPELGVTCPNCKIRRNIETVDSEEAVDHSCDICEATNPDLPTCKDMEATQDTVDYCLWENEQDTDNWHTSCGHIWTLLADTPHLNNMEYCPYCGKRLEESAEFVDTSTVDSVDEKEEDRTCQWCRVSMIGNCKDVEKKLEALTEDELIPEVIVPLMEKWAKDCPRFVLWEEPSKEEDFVVPSEKEKLEGTELHYVCTKPVNDRDEDCFDSPCLFWAQENLVREGDTSGFVRCGMLKPVDSTPQLPRTTEEERGDE